MLPKLLLPLALLFSACLPAQTVILPAKILFTGDPATPASELLAFTGLQPGASVPQAQLQQAAQNLSDTGLYADIRYASSPAGLTFTLTPMQSEFVLPARFSNFPWFQQTDLLAALQARVPLFHGLVPVKGNLQDKLIAALQAILAERGLPNAQVIAMPSTTPGAPPVLAFSIASPDVLVHAVTLENASPGLKPRLSLTLENLAGKPYEDGITLRSISDGLTSAYRNQGYLDITLTGLTHTAPQITPQINPQINPQAVNLDFTATVNEGDLYHLDRIEWPGSPILSTADFNKSATIHAGDVASLVAIRSTLRLIAVAYYRKGYQDAKVSAPEVRDRATHNVSYTASVTPGEQYRIHSIKTVGLSAEQQKDFDATWKMNQGEFYDLSYTDQFLLARTLPRSLLGYSGKWKAVSDPNTHLVDLTLTFLKGGTLVEVH